MNMEYAEPRDVIRAGIHRVETTLSARISEKVDRLSR
jgi:hypothetical protein